MPELALHILDLVQNSISAGASRVVVTVAYDTAKDMLTIVIEDDGKGMSEAFLCTVTSPFSTSRTTRKVGLGIPLFKQLAEMCEGGFEISSTVGVGTTLTAHFRASHVDLPPMGDLKGTIEALIIACPETPDFRFVYRVDEREFIFDTSEIREPLGYLPLNEPDIVRWIGAFVSEGMNEIKQSK